MAKKEIIRTTVSLPEDVHRRVNLAATKLNMAYGQVVLYAIQDWLQEKLPADVKRSIEFDLKHGPATILHTREQVEAFLKSAPPKPGKRGK